MRQFNQDFSEKACEADKDQSENTKSQKLQTTDELLALSYLSYLEQNNYLKSEKNHLFGHILQTGDQVVQNANESRSEHLFVFLEMIKVFFPGGDHLYAPDALQDQVS